MLTSLLTTTAILIHGWDKAAMAMFLPIPLWVGSMSSTSMTAIKKNGRTDMFLTHGATRWRTGSISASIGTPQRTWSSMVPVRRTSRIGFLLCVIAVTSKIGLD